MNYYPRHLGDYARDAGHLTLAEHGAYTLLLDRYYATERPIGREEAFKICHAVSKADKDAVGSVLREFFQVTSEGYRNKRADEEIARAREKSEKAKASINARWKQRSDDTNVIRTYEERKPDVILSNNQYPITKNQGALAGYSEQSESARRRAGTSRITPDLVVRAIGGTKA